MPGAGHAARLCALGSFQIREYFPVPGAARARDPRTRSCRPIASAGCGPSFRTPVAVCGCAQAVSRDGPPAAARKVRQVFGRRRDPLRPGGHGHKQGARGRRVRGAPYRLLCVQGLRRGIQDRPRLLLRARTAARRAGRAAARGLVVKEIRQQARDGHVRGVLHKAQGPRGLGRGQKARPRPGRRRGVARRGIVRAGRRPARRGHVPAVEGVSSKGRRVRNTARRIRAAAPARPVRGSGRGGKVARHRVPAGRGEHANEGAQGQHQGLRHRGRGRRRRWQNRRRPEAPRIRRIRPHGRRPARPPDARLRAPVRGQGGRVRARHRREDRPVCRHETGSADVQVREPAPRAARRRARVPRKGGDRQGRGRGRHGRPGSRLGSEKDFRLERRARRGKRADPGRSYEGADRRRRALQRLGHGRQDRRQGADTGQAAEAGGGRGDKEAGPGRRHDGGPDSRHAEAGLHGRGADQEQDKRAGPGRAGIQAPRRQGGARGVCRRGVPAREARHDGAQSGRVPAVALLRPAGPVRRRS